MSRTFRAGGRTFRVVDGWTKAELIMKTAEPMDFAEVRSFISGDTPNYEFAHIEQQGKKITAIYRVIAVNGGTL